jgi:hypothetical protein
MDSNYLRVIDKISNHGFFEVLFYPTFYKYRCKWFGHRWKPMFIGDLSKSHFTKKAPNGQFNKEDFVFSCKCGEVVSVDEYSMIKRDEKINKILG